MAYNITNPKVSVQWLIQAIYFYKSLRLVDNEVLRNYHFGVASNS